MVLRLWSSWHDCIPINNTHSILRTALGASYKKTCSFSTDNGMKNKRYDLILRTPDLPAAYSLSYKVEVAFSQTPPCLAPCLCNSCNWHIMLEGKKLLLSNHFTDGEAERAVSLLVALRPICAGTTQGWVQLVLVRTSRDCVTSQVTHPSRSHSRHVPGWNFLQFLLPTLW